MILIFIEISLTGTLTSTRDVTYSCHLKMTFMLLWLGWERQQQMWSAVVIWQWSWCYCDCDGNVNNKLNNCGLLLWYDSNLHVTVTGMGTSTTGVAFCCDMTAIFMSLWLGWERQQQVLLSVVIWQWSWCYWTGMGLSTANVVCCCDITVILMLL